MRRAMVKLLRRSKAPGNGKVGDTPLGSADEDASALPLSSAAGTSGDEVFISVGSVARMGGASSKRGGREWASSGMLPLPSVSHGTGGTNSGLGHSRDAHTLPSRASRGLSPRGANNQPGKASTRRSRVAALHSENRWRQLNYALLMTLLLVWTLRDYVWTRHELSLPSSSGARGSDDAQLRWLDQVHSVQYPLDIVLQVARGDLQWSTSSGPAGTAKFYPPGYAYVKSATFRDRYPTETAADTFDEIFVITNDRCQRQLQEFETRAKAYKLRYTKVLATPARDIDLNNPPIKLNLPENVGGIAGLSKVQVSLLKRQIGYTLSHKEIWKRAKLRNRQRILVLDDTLFPKERFLNGMANLFNWVDQESIAGSQPWHFIFFRRKILQEDWAAKNETFWEGSEEAWSPNHLHPVVRAKPSYGAGIYALSSQGIKWLVDHFDDYRAPMDIQISMLQREFPHEFIALSACNNDQPQVFCPEIVQDISIQESQSMYECTWRRMQELKVARDDFT
ncbi:hypothetical protein FVE85_6571 [Porphyridium purpureum]|uniref:Uncharacterized protein n=1 Tax=Porphyridium purpureum TaxID=35688 RepID=A0A5J4Z5N1_PORPP|nr:hypothetical protein FVE85_6571 [Porphyridium purpureum]|eukprot:POR5355..scf295_1